MGRLLVQVLGPLTIELDQTSLRPLRSNKAEALLVYLLAEKARNERDGLQREQLMTLLWPDMPESAARHNLRQVLYLLRQAIPEVPGAVGEPVPLLLSDRQQVKVNPDATYDLDLARFLALREQDGTADLATAVELYHGSFLADFYLEDSNQFETWAAAHRADLQRIVEELLSRLVQRAFAREQPGAAEALARRWAALDDLAEPPQQALVRALARQGRRAAAARHYQTYAARLETELGVEPTLALEELLADPPDVVPSARPAPGPRAPLPGFPTSFVGREKEVARLQEYVGRPDVRLVTVVGPGGAGKTRLAVEALRGRENTFPDGLFFIPLADLEEPDRLALAIAETLGLSLREQAPVRDQLLAYLRDRHCLLLLDNFEGLLPAAPLLEAMMAAAPGVRLVVTSQERLNLAGEWLLRLGGLPVTLDGGAEDAGPAVRLLLQAAARVRADFTLTAENQPDLLRICRLLHGIPLGIELAAFWLRHLDSATLADEIEQNIGFLESTLRSLPARHRSLGAIFDYTWQRLSEAERQLLRRLAVFQGGFNLPAARQVAGASLADLAALADKSILQPPATGSGRRYRIHAHLRQFLVAKLEADPATARAARTRHATFFAGWLAQRQEGLYGPELPHALDRVTTEIENVRAAWRWSAGAEAAPPDAARLEQMAQPLFLFYEVRGWFEEGESQFRLAGEQQLAPATRALILAVWGWFGFRKGNYREAYDRLEESVDLARDRRVRMFALSSQALLLSARGDVAEARERARAGLQAGHGLSAQVFKAFALHNLGSVARLQERYADAARHYQESRLLFQAVGNSYGAAFALINLGTVQMRLGQMAAAERAFREGLALCERAGYRYGRSVALRNLALVLLAGGDADSALPLAQESLSLAETMADVEGSAWALIALAQISAVRGRLPLALDSYGRARELFQMLDHHLGLAEVGTDLAEIALSRGELARARRHAEESLEIYRRLGQQEGQTIAHSLLARVAASAGQAEEAETNLASARALAAGLEARLAVEAVAEAEGALS